MRGKKKERVVCRVSSCERIGTTGYMDGYCHAHSVRVKKTGSPQEHIPIRVAGGDKTICVVNGCDTEARSSGYCKFHHSRLTNRPHIPINSPRQRVKNVGHTWTNAAGYPELWVNGKAVLEHRFVMEGILGRSLVKGENIHHINGVRNDNRPENLELWANSQPNGQRAVDLLDWARGIIAQYEPDEKNLREKGYTR